MPNSSAASMPLGEVGMMPGSPPQPGCGRRLRQSFLHIRHVLLHEVGADDAHAAVYVEPTPGNTAVGSDMSNAATFPMANP